MRRCNTCGCDHSASNLHACWATRLQHAIARRTPKGGCTHGLSITHICDQRGSQLERSESTTRNRYGPGLRRSVRVAGRGMRALRQCVPPIPRELLALVEHGAQQLHVDMVMRLSMARLSEHGVLRIEKFDMDTDRISELTKEKEKYSI